MTREMNSGLSAEGESVAYPFNADNQAKPEWHKKYYASIHCTPLANKCYICGNDICKYRIKERKLDDWIKPYIDSINERFKQC